jgi:hypothetical protein
MGSEAPVRLSVNDLEVLPIPNHEWRVCDERIPVHEGLRVLGIIEQRHDLFEALHLNQGSRQLTLQSFSQARLSFLHNDI